MQLLSRRAQDARLIISALGLQSLVWLAERYT
jgi:hypothetical protein